MAISKIILNGVTQMDVTQDTVAANNLISPNTAHGADGLPVVGTATAGITPSGTMSITSNGTYDVTSYASADVDVPSDSVEDKFISVIFYNHSEKSVSILYSFSNSVIGSSGYVEQGTTFSVSGNSSVTRVMPYGFSLTARTANISTGSGQNFDLYMNGVKKDPVIEGYAGSAHNQYVKTYNISKSALDGANNTIDFYASTDPYKETIIFDTLSVTSNGTYTPTPGYAYSSVEVNVPSQSPNLQAKTNINPTTSSQTITPDSGYDGLSSVQINAMPTGTAGTPTATKGTVSNHQVSVTPSVTNTAGYISSETKSGTPVTVTAAELASGNKAITNNGTGIDVVGYSTVSVNVTPSLQSKTNISPTTSSQTITADNGYDGLSSVQINAIPSGTAGTPSATKGTVSNHSVSVTPSVTNTTGYITGGTKTGTAVTVSASELVSGTYTVDSSGTKDVTNYASASVSAGTAGTPSATKGTVSNHQVSVTPSVTNTTGWITGGTKTGTAVTVTASELASGNKAIVDNGTNIDVVGYSTVSVAVPFSTIYSGTSDPSSSTGANGDIYVKTAN